jgi:hypothetical protein
VARRLQRGEPRAVTPAKTVKTLYGK